MCFDHRKTECHRNISMSHLHGVRNNLRNCGGHFVFLFNTERGKVTMPVSNDLPDQCPLRRQQSMHNTNSVDLSGLKVGMAFAIHFDSLTNAPHGFGVFMGADRGFFLPHVTFINEITTQDNVRFSKSPVSNFAHEDARKRCFLHHLNDQDWKKLMKNLPPLIVSMCGGMRSLIPNCSACNQGFTNAEELACHKCLCPHCAQPFRRKTDFLAHVAKCAQPIPNCSACNQGFTNAEELACHKCVCPKCAQPFRRKPDFRRTCHPCGRFRRRLRIQRRL